MSDYNPKEYRREKFNKKHKDNKSKSYNDDYIDLNKKNKAFKKQKQELQEEYDWEQEYDELY